MSQITLKPLDDGQKAVEIPLGKTTIGRGPFLGCSDKKVSRNHAVLEVNSKGEVFLTPTHVNPCFYQPTADSPGQILKKDTPHKLENGDSFSLLPRAYRYQLIVLGDAKDEKNSDQNDLNKQCGKTNGSTGDGPEEENKDSMKSGEEPGDAVVEKKPHSKEEDLLTNIDKNHSKENFSKKLPDVMEDKSQLSKENKEINKENEAMEKESSPPKENNFSRKGSPSTEVHSKAETEQDRCVDEAPAEDEAIAQTEHSKVNNGSGEESDPSDEQTKVDKLEGGSETMLNNDSFPKNIGSKTDNISHDDKPDKKISEDTVEDKRMENCEESRDEGTLDTLPSKEFVSEEEESLPERTKETPTKRGARKKAAPVPKQPRGEGLTTKRKAVLDSVTKPKGRKKIAAKFDFGPGEEGNSQRQVAGRTSSRTNRQTRQGLSLEDFIVSDDDEWQSDRSEPKQRRKRGSRRGDDSGSDWETEHKKSKKPIHKVGSGSESGSDWGSQKKKKGVLKGKRRKSKRTASEAGSEEEADQTASNATKSDKPRLPCTYGKKCYRRNQKHVDQFCHPGDSDYASEAEATPKDETVSENETESVKKECPYGANCFRKNAQHKKDFKHTKKVRPQREAAKQADKKTKGSRNSDEVDSYDLNDSFLNDDSADEYKPIDSGSDYESGEKLKRLAKAKAGKTKRGRKV